MVKESKYGADLPDICYFSSKDIYIYDDNYVFVIEREKGKIIDLFNKGELGFNAKQGDYASDVEVSADGKKYMFIIVIMIMVKCMMLKKVIWKIIKK